MLEVTLDPIVKKTNKILENLNKWGDIGGGDPVEYNSGPMGLDYNRKKKRAKKNLPQDINDEQYGYKEALSKIAILKDMDGGPVTQAGFGTTDIVDNVKDNKVMPKDINNEKPFVKRYPKRVSKASYELTGEEQSWTDEESPKDDSFYLPAKLDEENGDTNKAAKERKKKQEEIENKYTGYIDENVGDQGKARAKQQYNAGTIENAQIGGQGV